MDNPYYERLVNAAIRFVSFRPRSEKELRDFLHKKLSKYGAAQWALPGGEVSGSVLLDKVIARMGELGYVNDEKFAIWWVEQRTEFKPKGNNYIKMELRAKGIADDIISSILASRGAESLVIAAKRAIGRKRFETPQKLYNYLARRGFDSNTIKKVQ